MNTVQKWGTAVLGIALVTTLILPKRQTVQVFGAAQKLITGTLATAMGTTSKINAQG